MRAMTRMMTAAILGAGLALSAPAAAQEGGKLEATTVDWRYRGGYYAPPPAYYAPPPGYYYAPPPPPRPRYYAPPPVYYYAPPRPRYHRPPPPPGVSLHFRF